MLFSTIIFPPQITIISLFQILVQYGLYNSKIGLTLVYVAIQLPLTIYILESFFARIPDADRTFLKEDVDDAEVIAAWARPGTARVIAVDGGYTIR